MEKRILIVDDDKMLCTVFQMFLRDAGYNNVDVVHTGTGAIEYCQQNTPDIILMDIRLNGSINGVETAKKITDLVEVPIIYVTSDIERETIKSAITKNIYGFLVKPVLPVNLIKTIEFAFYKFKFDIQ